MKYWYLFNVVVMFMIKNIIYLIFLFFFYFFGKCIFENLLKLVDCFCLIVNFIVYNYNVFVYKWVFKKYLIGFRMFIVGFVCVW